MNQNDVKYGDHPRQCGNWLVADKPDKLVVLVHGGAFVFGSKENVNDTAINIKQSMNAAVFVPNYRLSNIDSSTLQYVLNGSMVILLFLALLSNNIVCLSLLLINILLSTVVLICMVETHENDEEFGKGNSKFPAQLNDVASSIAFAKKTFPDLALFLIGHSAGGYITTMISLDSTYLLKHGLSIKDITGCISISGVYSSARLHDTSLAAGILNRSVFDGCTSIQTAFPLQCLYHLMPADVSALPPFFVINSSMDLSLTRHARDFVGGLVEHGARVCWEIYSNCDHFSVRKKWEGENKIISENIRDFMSKVENQVVKHL